MNQYIQSCRFGLILRWKCGSEYDVLLNETVQRKYMSIVIKIKDNSLEWYIVCLSKMSLDKANNVKIRTFGTFLVSIIYTVS